MARRRHTGSLSALKAARPNPARPGPARALAIFILLIVLVASGAAHRPSSPPLALSPEIAAYLNDGGALATLCGDFSSNGAAHGGDCEACRIWASCLAPMQAGLPTIPRRRAAGAAAPTPYERVAQAAFDPSRPTRAPPAV